MRIIAGTHRGTRLKEPAEVTRPTSDRVREAIFNVLRHVVPEARVLDLFAGTGALGLEALSRGARSCHFVEREAQALRCLHDNLRHTGFSTAKVIADDALAYLARVGEEAQYDLILADPPYYRDGAPDLASPLWEKPLPLAAGGIVMVEVEAERETPEDPPFLTLVKRKNYGKTTVLYFEAKSSS
ncbi:16S rRNA (guanine(966)-N(2))-methyltransferase RsmD [Roseibacillus ishigakijimensis]|uniref:16S rRNA (Guanine(966)-N(2))-methyltransferase RsmD n=1 Tax=Roseibacillus ishigakijimensis TaxID=454146 RepID=A0A934RPC5_9BACT|nr:16S rRNA (guanine(966)-N(2))-methyltransferase RsmD [Roseibacillus ishigakijimensis]MBK1834503.1 16S rRNA (guanine(966)-N(2))-methyltransferase RsmD [Roseibacillus ishigakijimensis]